MAKRNRRRPSQNIPRQSVVKQPVQKDLQQPNLNQIMQPSGLTQRKVVNSGYSHYGASYARKSLLGWMSYSASADEDIVENIKTLRARSRDLYMGVPLATSAIKAVRTNVIGSGLMLSSHIDYKKLGLTEEQAVEWQKNTEREWLLWAESPECDAARMCNFYEFQALAFISALMSGDCFVALPYIKRTGVPYDLRLSLIEADRVCDPVAKFKTDTSILEGVEIGHYGEPVAYYVAKYHPYSMHRPLNDAINDWKRIPAYSGSGRRNMLHLMCDIERPGQRRGVPLLAPAIEAFKQLGRYTDAELVAAVVSGYFTVFITHDNPESGVDPMVSTAPDGSSLAVSELTSDPDDVSLSNGGIVNLAEGEHIETSNPGRPNTAFEPFVNAICRQIGASLEIPYELLLKSFTSSYSASRGAILEAWKMFRMRRQWVVNRLCQPVYEEWLSEAVAKGRVIAPGFFSDPSIKKAWCGADWAGDTQGQLDPTKEAQAAKLRVEEGFSTRDREAAELTGMSFDVIMSQRKREERLMQESGIKPVSPVAPVSPVQTPDTDNDDDTEDDSDDKPRK